MRFDDDFIEKVIDANNIIDIISQHTDLKGRGDQHMGLCPFPDHNEKSPSFSVSEGKQLYHCFGCKKSGNIITFLKDYSGFSFVEAIEHLAARAHIEIPKDPSPQRRSQPQNREIKSQMHRINRFAAVFYHQKLKNLPATHKLRAYLQKRNLTEEIIEEFRLGYASDEWGELNDFLQSKRAPLKVSHQLGLIRQNKKGGYFDLFRDRLMFPIFSIDSQVIGFGGRIIDQGQPKYINSVESDVFKKGTSFYGLDKTAKHIKSEDRVFVVEGYMDLLSLYSKGVKNVVATLGTALTENHVRLLKRWTKTIILLFDGDQAGRTASERSLPHFLKHDLLPQVLELPQGQDPDDFIQEHGKERFLSEADKAKDLFFQLLGRWMEGYRGQPKEKVELLDRVSPLLLSLGDSRLQQMYGEELARRLGEDLTKVWGWIQAKKTNPSKYQEPKPVAASKAVAEPTQAGLIDLNKVPVDELVLLGMSLKKPEFLDFFLAQEGIEAIGDKNLQSLFQQVVDRYRQDPSSFGKLAHLVVSRVQNPERIVNLINISSSEDDPDRDEKTLKECFIRIKDRFLQRQASVLVNEMKNDPSGAQLERFVNIQEKRKSLKDLLKRPPGES